MASGTIYGTTSNSDIQARIVWSSTTNIDNNTSTVTATLAYKKTATYANATYSREFDGSITINGNKKTIAISRSSSNRIYLYTGAGWVTMGTHSVTVAHNNDGSKSITISATGGMSGTSFTSTSLSKSVALDTIPREATLTAAPNFNDEANPTITYSNPAGNAVSSLQACISLDGSKADIAYRDISKTGSSYTFNLTTAERNVLRNATTTANSRKVRFYIQTKIGDNTYRNYLEKTLTITNANPTLTPTAYDNSSTTTALTGDNNKLVRYYSDVYYIIEKAALKGATIKSVTVKCGSKSASGASLAAGTLTDVDGADVVFTVTDSRGNTTTKTLNKTLISYIKLTCGLSAAAPTTDGNLTLTASGNYFNGSFGAVANTLTVQYRIKENNGSYSSWTAATASISGNKYTATATITGLNYKSTYTVQMRAIDKLATVNSATKSLKTTPVFDWGADDFAFNVPVAFNAGFTNSNKVLWSGSYYMTEGQTANLNEAISNQASGIVLVFSRYDISNSQPLNEHFCYHFVPKQIIALHAGKGSVFNMSTSNETFSASKYLYIDDTSISGHTNNDAIGTGDTGVSYANNRFVLRYVIGV